MKRLSSSIVLRNTVFAGFIVWTTPQNVAITLPHIIAPTVRLE